MSNRQTNGVVFDEELLPAGLYELIRVQSGSRAHGVGTGDDDTDIMGVCIEPPSHVIGLDRFEQFEHRTAWDRTGTTKYTHPQPESKPGDTDTVIYTLRKWASMALSGNPTAMMILFAPIISLDVPAGSLALGLALRANTVADYFYSARVGLAYLDWMRREREALVTRASSAPASDPPTFAKKAAYLTRLGIQGCEYVRSRRLSLPMDDMHRELVLSVRRGEVPLNAVIDLAINKERLIREYMDERPPMPTEPDRDAVNQFVIRMYQTCWQRNLNHSLAAR